jgi:hypothetical protein
VGSDAILKCDGPNCDHYELESRVGNWISVQREGNWILPAGWAGKLDGKYFHMPKCLEDFILPFVVAQVKREAERAERS